MKAILYVRVSSKEQSEGYSLDAQIDLLQAYASKNGFEVTRVFQETESAKKGGRPLFNEMLQMIEKTPGLHLLVEKTDRLYRNAYDWATLDPDRLSVNIHLVKENEILQRDSKSHQKFIHGIKVLMAKNFIDNLSEETRKGMYKKLESGGYPFMAPVGYKNNPISHDVVIDDEYAPFIRRAFDEFSSGRYSLMALNQMLYDEGFRSKRAKSRPNKEAMKRVLTNKFYYGVMEVKGTLYQGKHQPLISKELYDRVQKLIGDIRKPRLGTKDLAFKGLLKCAHCGRSITGEEKRKASGKTWVYYHCTGVRGECSNVTYLEEKGIEAAFSRAIAKLSIPEEVVELTRKALIQSHESQQEYHQNALKSIRIESSKLQRLIDGAYEDKLLGRLEAPEWERRSGEWRRKLIEVNQSIQTHNDAQAKTMLQGVNLLELAQRAHSLYERQPMAQKQELIRKLFSNCTVKDGSVEIVWRKPFALMVGS